MSGYIELNRTGFGPFDDSLSLIEEAGDSYHHTSKWLDEGWNGEKPYIARINESIEFAANSYSDLIDALTALKTENETAWAQAHRLALELECLLLDTKDNAIVSKWWGSGMEALDEYRRTKPGAKEDAEAWAKMRKEMK